MSKITLLDQNTINQIAAGEVIERPASIVKELIENSIDADSNAITIEIKDGGISFIRITDNGSGIDKDDIEIAFLRHSTSKIKSAIDLLTVSSLGFRGEALSSISAVSMVELITKKRDALMGSRYEISGSSKGILTEVGVPDGTTFIVRNLFFNTPARRKFLKSSQTEASYINDVVSRIALSHPEISFRFINNSKLELHTTGNGNLKDVIYSVYGKEVCSNLLNLELDNEYMKIKGFIGKPSISKGNRSFENYFINGRYIKSTLITESIEEGFKEHLMQHRFPFTCLHFDIKSELLDVNVHPSKMELRFRDSENLYPLIINAIKEAFSYKELIPKVSLDNHEKTTPKANIEYKIPEYFEKNRIKEVKEEKDYKSVFLEPEVILEPVVNLEPENTKSEQLDLFSEKLLSENARKKHRLLGQLFNTYWIIEYGEDMYIIDQHAAHEKVLYERTLKRLESGNKTSQNLAIPWILSLSLKECETLNTYMDELTELGYEIEAFGGREYAVRSVPAELFSISEKDLLKELIEGIADDNSIRKDSTLIKDKIAKMSCKAAVKGNNSMSFMEMDHLIDDLLTLDNPYNCPHGRPTIISMSKYEIEKKFKRIV